MAKVGFSRRRAAGLIGWFVGSVRGWSAWYGSGLRWKRVGVRR